MSQSFRNTIQFTILHFAFHIYNTITEKVNCFEWFCSRSFKMIKRFWLPLVWQLVLPKDIMTEFWIISWFHVPIFMQTIFFFVHFFASSFFIYLVPNSLAYSIQHTTMRLFEHRSYIETLYQTHESAQDIFGPLFAFRRRLMLT